MPASTQGGSDELKSISVLGLSGGIRAREEVSGFGGTAVAAAAPAGGGGGGDDAAPVEEQTAFDVILEAAGDKKIQVIKEVRALTSLGLGEAKALVDGAPKAVLEGANKEAAEKAKAQLEGAGATVTLK